VVAAALLTLGVLAAGEALNPSHPEHVAGYGSHQTAEITGEDADVRHDFAVHLEQGLATAGNGVLFAGV
jgi:hypothetical protein